MSKVFDNPLLHSIRQLLAAAPGSLTEHELIKLLQSEVDDFPELAESPKLALFQTHFLVMNALYQLQAELFEARVYLHISPLAIGLRPVTDAATSELVEAASQEKLRDYYSDWRHFQRTDERAVESLLAGFWQHYLAQDKQADAYRCLQLEPGCGWDSVKQAYRRMAASCHPDRGGDPAEFMSVRQAYEVLARTVGASER